MINIYETKLEDLLEAIDYTGHAFCDHCPVRESCAHATISCAELLTSYLTNT